ncbi:MAG: hypothetical protein ACJAUK_002434 [Colwellia polaris]|jgi:hypothetical protein
MANMNQIETKGLFLSQDRPLAWGKKVCASVGNDVKNYFGINVFYSNILIHLKAIQPII